MSQSSPPHPTPPHSTPTGMGEEIQGQPKKYWYMLHKLHVGTGMAKRKDQESRVGAAARALAFHQCGLGLIPAWCQMWLSLLLVLALLLGFFSRFSGFPHPSPQKPTKVDMASSLIIVKKYFQNHCFYNQKFIPGFLNSLLLLVAEKRQCKSLVE